MSLMDDISSAVLRGKRKEVTPLVQQAIDEGMDPEVILNEGLVSPMDIIGEKFSKGEAFVPEMLIAARAMNAGTAVLKPYLVDAGAESMGKAVIGTVKGDMHDIGKNLVRMMIEGKGIEIVDLGVDVDPQQFVDYIKENPDCHLVCCSALLTTTMPEMKNTVEAFESAGLRNDVKIMIGGAPVTQAFCDAIGADSYTENATEAANVAVELISK